MKYKALYFLMLAMICVTLCVCLDYAVAQQPSPSDQIYAIVDSIPGLSFDDQTAMALALIETMQADFLDSTQATYYLEIRREFSDSTLAEADTAFTEGEQEIQTEFPDSIFVEKGLEWQSAPLESTLADTSLEMQRDFADSLLSEYALWEWDEASDSASAGAELDQQYDFSDSAIAGTYLESMKHMVSAGIFEEMDPYTVADVVYKAYLAERSGAPAQQVEDLALIGFARDITVDQLEMSAKALRQFTQTTIPHEVYQELLTCAMENDWSGEVIAGVAEGLLSAHDWGVDTKELALSIIIRVNQGLEGKTIEQVVQEELDFVRKIRTRNKAEEERRDIAYRGLKFAAQNGVPSEIGYEVYYIAIEDRWPVRTIKAAYQGIAEGAKMGLTPEKLATLLITDIAQGKGDTDPQRMVAEAIESVKIQIDCERLAARTQIPPSHLRPTTTEPSPYKPEEKKPTVKTPTIPPKPYTAQSGRLVGRLNRELMEESVRTFMEFPLSTPYRWRGQTREGSDPSGFTSRIYREQQPPILIPHGSEDQYEVGVSVEQSELQYGDLVFFSKYGEGHIAYMRLHVGLYVGNGMFVQATCSKGIAISELDKPYYQARYVGARRITAGS